MSMEGRESEETVHREMGGATKHARQSNWDMTEQNEEKKYCTIRCR